MADNSKKSLTLIGVISIIGLLALAMWYLTRPKPAYGNLDAFAQCLAKKEVTMYGADWCSHCQNEKKEFGKSFKYVPYVECPDNPKQCLEKGVKGYPTWIFPDGTRLEGEQGPEGLSKASGCALPKL
ncbi:MAG: protein disulfide isomerase family protein [Nanoarchaeota archaeon]|nr:protein disulfide isomerase family protein [Nanoarchaeota archaeon]